MVSHVGEAAADVLRGAYYYALADGHAVVQTSLVLASAARNDREVAAPLLGQSVADARSALAVGGIVTEDLPASGVVPAGCEYRAALREARWWVVREVSSNDRKRFGLPEDGRGGPVWGEGVCAALDRAGIEAATAGVPRIGIAQLILGLLDGHDPSTESTLRYVGLDAGAVAATLRTRPPDATPQPFPILAQLRMLGAVEDQAPWLVRWIPRVFGRLAARDRRWGGPVLAGLELEVMRQAVRLGHDVVATSAVLLAIISIHEQLDSSGVRLRGNYLPYNRGGRVLAEAGVETQRAWEVAEGVAEATAPLPAGSAAPRFWGNGKPGDPFWGEVANRVMDRARPIAMQRQHRSVGTSHLLAALLDEPSCAAMEVLAELGVDHRRIRDQIEEDLDAA